MILKMNLGPNSYDIVIKKGAYNKMNEEIKAVYDKQKIYIITDSNVGPLYLDKIKNELHDFKVYSVCVEAGEQSKSFETYKEVLTKLLDLEIKRGELLIALQQIKTVILTKCCRLVRWKLLFVRRRLSFMRLI